METVSSIDEVYDDPRLSFEDVECLARQWLKQGAEYLWDDPKALGELVRQWVEYSFEDDFAEKLTKELLYSGDLNVYSFLSHNPEIIWKSWLYEWIEKLQRSENTETAFALGVALRLCGKKGVRFLLAMSELKGSTVVEWAWDHGYVCDDDGEHWREI